MAPDRVWGRKLTDRGLNSFFLVIPSIYSSHRVFFFLLSSFSSFYFPPSPLIIIIQVSDPFLIFHDSSEERALQLGFISRRSDLCGLVPLTPKGDGSHTVLTNITHTRTKAKFNDVFKLKALCELAMHNM